LLETSGALDYAWERAERHAASALAALDCLAETNAKGVLRSLAHYVVRRSA